MARYKRPSSESTAESCVSDVSEALVHVSDTSTGISQLSILPDHQGKGLGRKLMAALIGAARCREMNIALAGAQGKFALRTG